MPPSELENMVSIVAGEEEKRSSILSLSPGNSDESRTPIIASSTLALNSSYQPASIIFLTRSYSKRKLATRPVRPGGDSAGSRSEGIETS